jgi:signal transduction histidine kinase/CheY-like chemotaxis protein/HPt (histidine-containing phosphotransfer) domain-containing protein
MHLMGAMKKIKQRRLLYLQILFVLLAFAAMVITSYFFMRAEVRSQLVRNANSMFAYSQAKIESDLQEPETTLGSFAITMRRMIQDGWDLNHIRAFVQEYSAHLKESQRRVSSFDGVFGWFRTMDGRSAFGDAFGKDPIADYRPEDRPWYKAAIAGAGQTVETPPYMDVRTGKMVFAFAREVRDNRDRLIAVVGLNVPLDIIGKDVVETAMSQRGYGVLLDQDLTLLAHPEPSYVGKNVLSLNIPLAGIAGDLQRGKDVFNHSVPSYKDEPSIAFFRQISNGWYLGLIAPKEGYYQSVTDMAWKLFLLSMLCSGIVIVLLVRIDVARNKLDMASRQKSAFLANMSHEIRTPMNAIMGITEIQQGNKALPPDTQEALDKIYNSANILMGIINDILDLSKIEAGKLELMPIKYDVASIINDTVQLNMMRFESRPLDFKLNVNEAVPATLFGDELRIKQILNNLLSNAVKYTKNGEVELTVDAERVDAFQVMLILRVRDTGVGMTAEQIDQLFDEYARFNSEANRGTEGTGLGMPITRNLVQMMNGHIAVESKPGKGSLFIVRLPQGVAGEGIIGGEVADNLGRFRVNDGVHKKKTQVVREYMPYGSVLVVDDVQTNLYVAIGLMQPYGLHIETVLSGFESIEKIKNGRVYDIIFMDHMMPEIDGIEAVKRIRGLGYSHPIVALTANAMAGQADIFLANGFDAFLSKPIDVRQLNALLNKMIRDKQPPEVIEAAHRQNVIIEKNNSDLTSQSQLMPELAESAAKDASEALATLEAICKKDAIGDKDVNTYVLNVHAMKSVLAIIGESKLSEYAFRLEMAGKRGDVAAMLAETPAFLTLLSAVILKIQSTKEDAINTAVDADKELLFQKLLAIRTACEAYDITTADALLAELKQKVWSQVTKDALQSINEHLLHSDFDEAARSAANYAHTIDRNA